MQERLRRFMKSENINSSRLAEILAIQSSGISHILSGRNKPSYDFVSKMLSRFPQLNPDWFILGKGPMYREQIKSAKPAELSASSPAVDTTSGSDFIAEPLQSSSNSVESSATPAATNDLPFDEDLFDGIRSLSGAEGVQTPLPTSSSSRVEQIVVFYSNGTCRSYKPVL